MGITKLLGRVTALKLHGKNSSMLTELWKRTTASNYNESQQSCLETVPGIQRIISRTTGQGNSNEGLLYLENIPIHPSSSIPRHKYQPDKHPGIPPPSLDGSKGRGHTEASLMEHPLFPRHPIFLPILHQIAFRPLPNIYIFLIKIISKILFFIAISFARIVGAFFFIVFFTLFIGPTWAWEWFYPVAPLTPKKKMDMPEGWIRVSICGTHEISEFDLNSERRPRNDADEKGQWEARPLFILTGDEIRTRVEAWLNGTHREEGNYLDHWADEQRDIDILRVKLETTSE